MILRVIGLIFLISLQPDKGGGFLLDGLNLQLLPRGVRNAMEAMDLVFVRLYSRANGWQSRFLRPRDSPARMLNSGWDPRLPTMVIVHGYLESPTTGCVPIILEAFRQTSRPMNVVVLDWGSLAAGPWYYTAHNNADYVALSTARALDFLVRIGGSPPTTLHLVGCGLGARVAARAAANVSMPGVVGRITGLDPWYGNTVSEQRLATRVAYFSDAIHTDAGVYSHRVPVGHVDFYPNGGISPQPGCELGNVFRGTNVAATALCSHVRAYHYFAESIRTPFAYMATPCENWSRFRGGRCRFASIVVPMGYSTPISARGNFYVDTNRRPRQNRPTIPSGPSSSSALQVIEAPDLEKTIQSVFPPPENILAPPQDTRTPTQTTMDASIQNNKFESISPTDTPNNNGIEVIPAQVDGPFTDKLQESPMVDNNETDNNEIEPKRGMRQARLWSQAGVNALSTFVRLADLNLVK